MIAIAEAIGVIAIAEAIGVIAIAEAIGVIMAGPVDRFERALYSDALRATSDR